MVDTPEHFGSKSDPTTLTTAQLHRELSSLRELIEARLDGTDKRIEIQFIERDKRSEQTAKDSKVAVDAAFSAAKEAVGEQNKSSALAIAKSEAATTKQIDSISLLISASSKATDEKIEDVKARLQMIEGQKQGVDRTVDKTDSRAANSATQIIAIVAVLTSIAVAAIDIMRH